MELSDYILVLLYKMGGKLEGKTRLQKLTFLGKYEMGIPLNARFKWEHYGPFSGDIGDTVDIMFHEGLLEIDDETRTSFAGDTYEIRKFRLTKEGKLMAQAFMELIDDPNVKGIERICHEFGYEKLQDILDYVYSKYSPEDLEE